MIVSSDHLLPAYWASALVNNDFSDISTEELFAMQEWIKREDPGICVSCSDIPFYSNTNSGTLLAGDCLFYTFHK